jgi:hypothetical protein
VKAGSWNTWLATFEVGERRYVETTLDDYAQQMRTMNTPRSRRPSELAGCEFTTSLFTAVSASSAGDIRYLIAVERTS